MSYSQLIDSIIVEDVTNPTELITWQTANPLAIISGVHVVGQVFTIYYALSSQTPILKTGSLTTTATTVDQVVLTYTVTTGKTLFLEYLHLDGWLTSLPGNANPIALGRLSLETPSGVKDITVDIFHPSNKAIIFTFPEPLSIATGDVIRVVTTPVTTSSITWRANFGGYEI